MNDVLDVAGTEWGDRARELADDGWLLTDLCGVDLLGIAGSDERFIVRCHLLKLDTKELLSVRVTAPGDPPTTSSVVPVWPVANFFEREAYDMFGIHFEGHPNLTRILMPDEWEGYPLRKDYGVGKVTIEFVPQPFLQVDSPGQGPDAEAARVEVDHLGQSGPPLRRSGNPPGWHGAKGSETDKVDAKGPDR